MKAMKRCQIAATKLVFILCLLPCLIFANENSLEDDLRVKEGIRLFSDWLEGTMAKEAIPAACVALIHEDKILWKRCYNCTPDTLFAVSSLTKPFTACAVMKLWQEGKLNLDESIEKIMPNFQIRGYTGKRSITPRMLLNHTSGLPQDADFPYWNDLEFPSFHAMWQKMKSQELVYTPGTRWKYSHLGYGLLGKVVEIRSNLSYSEYLQKEFFTPLQMQKTTFLLATNDKSFIKGYSLSIGHKPRGLVPFYDTRGLDSALGLYSTLNDLSRFVSFFMGYQSDTLPLELSTIRYMVQNSVRVHKFLSYSLGWSVRQEQELQLIEHPGTMPGYSAYISISPQDHTGLVIVTNAESHLVPWANSAARWLFRAVRDAKKRPNAQYNVPPIWKKYAGKYACREGELFVEIFQGTLVIYQPSHLNMLDTLLPQEDGTFRILQGYTFGDTNGDLVTFELDTRGDVVWMKIGNLFLRPSGL